ncbi:MAG: hypothetical protein J3Q66DRAFT_333867 [Benniella sp.]|nr:MAG: hypothetical protein J3Q66DRAFT_333867 [Benniella sp.]
MCLSPLYNFRLLDMTVPQDWLKWAQRIDDNEHVSFQNFVAQFGLTDQTTATQGFLELLESDEIRQKRRDALKASFNYFRINNEQQFWIQRTAEVEFQMSAARAGLRIDKAGEVESKITCTNVLSKSREVLEARQDDLALPSLHPPLVHRKPSRLASIPPLKPQFVQGDKTSAGELSSATPASETVLSADFGPASSTLPNSTPTSSASAPSAPPRQRKSFTNKNRLSLEGRYRNLGEKWVLESGTVVEDVLYTAGSNENCAVFSPIHSFMIDLDDPNTETLFSEADWKEIRSDLPPFQHYGDEADKYLDQCMDVDTKEGLKAVLEMRQQDPECRIIHYCLDQWEELLISESSPFPVAAQLGEPWWKENAWGVCRRLATAVKDAFIIMGEKAGHDSTERRNQDISNDDRKRIGVKADFLWRTISSPDVDWSAGESATVWDPASMKYRHEGVFKLPRQLHDILVARTSEVGGVDSLRKEYVCGLLTGGPVIQKVQICWGTKGKNITRFFRSPERRLFSTVQELGTSLLAVHDLLILRATTLRLCRTYETSRHQLAKEQAKKRRQELPFPSAMPNEKRRKFSLLSSSP